MSVYNKCDCIERMVNRNNKYAYFRLKAIFVIQIEIMSHVGILKLKWVKCIILLAAMHF